MPKNENAYYTLCTKCQSKAKKYLYKSLTNSLFFGTIVNDELVLSSDNVKFFDIAEGYVPYFLKKQKNRKDFFMRNTKHSLFTSLISLLLCASMLLGTTFAWFTDIVSSDKNVIQSGNLDAQMFYSEDYLAADDAG